MARYGFHLLVMVALTTIAASAIPLLLSRDHKDPLEYGLRDFLDKEHSIFASLFILRGMAITAGLYLFPLFVYFSIGNTVDAGTTRALANIGALFFTLMIGKITTKISSNKMVVFGTTTSALFFFFRSLVKTPVQAFIVSTLSGLFFMVYYIPLYSTLADYAEDEDIVEFYALRETFLGIGKITITIIAAILTYQHSIEYGIKTSFFITGVAVFIIPILTRKLELD
ncbi:MAG: MFS transporter [Candidatus Nanohaloarchaea archaeon]